MSKRQWVLLGGAIMVIVILYLTRNKIKAIMTRGYQNKNPGNIVKTFDNAGKQTFWTGEIVGTDSRFKTFKTMPYGYRAMLLNLQSYIKSGTDTIDKIINTWAPPAENNTAGYKSRVSSETGIPVNVSIASNDTKTLASIMAAISQVENGIPADMTEIQAGIKLL